MKIYYCASAFHCENIALGFVQFFRNSTFAAGAQSASADEGKCASESAGTATS